MKKILTTLTAGSLCVASTPIPSSANVRASFEVDALYAPKSDNKTAVAAPVKRPPTKPMPKPPLPKVSCLGCNANELKVLRFLHKEGVKDRKAQATILGTVKQESRFTPSVCEGGFITSYRGCTRGGFGILQWTDSSRYYGLGRFAAKIGKAPESIDTQLLYMISEPDWKVAERTFKTPGLSFHSYERAERRWIRWGIRGNRNYYAQDYFNRIIHV